MKKIHKKKLFPYLSIPSSYINYFYVFGAQKKVRQHFRGKKNIKMYLNMPEIFSIGIVFKLRIPCRWDQNSDSKIHWTCGRTKTPKGLEEVQLMGCQKYSLLFVNSWCFIQKLKFRNPWSSALAYLFINLGHLFGPRNPLKHHKNGCAILKIFNYSENIH